MSKDQKNGISPATKKNPGMSGSSKLYKLVTTFVKT
jgi:hypothetical protein